MSRRARRAEPPTGPGGGTVSRRTPDAEPPADAQRPAGRAILLDVLILAAVFGIAVGVAELAGAANLGVSFGIGQLCFALALIVLLTRD